MTPWAPVPPIRQPPSVWTVLAAALGVVALAGGLLPFYADLPLVVAVAATVIAVLGVAAGLAGLAHTRGAGRMVSAPAVFGMVAGGLAVVLGVTAVVVGVVSVREQQRRTTLDTATVLRKELRVTFGDFDYTGVDSFGFTETQLSVTMRNKLNRTRYFRIAVAAFDRDHHQVASASSAALLAANAAQTLELFGYVSDAKTAELLTHSTFRIIDATSEPVT